MNLRSTALDSDFLLLERHSGGEVTTMPVDSVQLAAGTALLAIDENGARQLLLPVDPDLDLVSDKESAGIHVTELSLVDGGKRRKFLAISCLIPDLHDVFSTIVGDMLDAVERAEGRIDEAVVAVLENWRELLRRASTRRLSVEMLRGLFGELWHLGRLHDAGAAATDLWMGPGGGAQDFMWQGHRLESKASRSRNGWRVKINGLEQLHGPESDRLVLSALKLELHPSDGRSVPDLIEELVARGVPSLPLKQKVAEAGLAADDYTEARQFRFLVADHRAWDVGSEFPCLTPALFAGGETPVGIARVDYDLDLTGWPGDHLDAAAFDALLVGAA